MHTPQDIQKHVKSYLIVFVTLAVLTIVTVLVSYWHLSLFQAVCVALLIASIKGSLVAAFFMHLISEKKVIYAILALTVLFFAVALLVPVFSPVTIPTIE
jgi:cytochrome c oxidase subunit 4